ncbi:MAG: UDP-3-O-(3-hydroxymyristoyl)glucosamine N-acyltransferase [Phycisphaerae bacterium]|nr:UDP-3-O-(3-hydroxymyristoyl)glucosamine N-acyltransferase [Phycisphaerae bacterium]|tara:strand:- start:56 stop:1102 length:1047 start_codon:yes stop_codon:yes gene_type:complete
MLLSELAQQVDAVLDGDGVIEISACAGIREAGPHEVTFLANAKYQSHLSATKAAAVFIRESDPCPEGVNRLICDDPYFAFRNATVILHGHRVHPEVMEDEGRGISSRAVIHPEASIGNDNRIHPNVTIEKGARIGDRCHLYPGVYIGPDVEIGDDCILYANVAVYDGCKLGNRVTVHACSAIGNDGFGYATHAGAHHKIPQTGITILEDDVEIGSNCAIERATLGATVVGEGTKFADLISIGHGTTIGKHCLLVSLVGIAGSVEVGDYVALGGQTGVAGHLRIGNQVQALAKTGITGDVPDGSIVGGAPAVDADTAKRNALAAMSLGALVRRVRSLERTIDKMNQREE